MFKNSNTDGVNIENSNTDGVNIDPSSSFPWLLRDINGENGIINGEVCL